MSNVKLLTVEDHFWIESVGMVLVPDFSVPDGWRDRVEYVTVVRPDGERYETAARFVLTHVNIADPEVPVNRRWRVVLILPDRSKSEIPPGSTILAPKELGKALRRGEGTET